MKKTNKRKPFTLLMLLMVLLLLPCTAKAASKTFTPIGQYCGGKVKLGKYYVYKGGPDARFFAYSKKKNPTESQQTTLAAREDAVSNGTVILSYRDNWDTGSSIRNHSIFKMNMKDGSEKRIKVIKDKQDPMNSARDGFKFGTAYGSKLYYNATQKLTKSGSSYKRTYKLMSLDINSKKVKTVRKNFEILGSTKEYIFGRTNKNVYYVFQLKKNKFYKVSGLSKSALVTTHAYKNKVYGAQFTKAKNEGYQKIVIFSFNGSKKKIVKIKTLTAGGNDYLDGYFETNSFKYTKNTASFYKFNLVTKKTTSTTARDYDYDLDPDYGDEEE